MPDSPQNELGAPASPPFIVACARPEGCATSDGCETLRVCVEATSARARRVGQIRAWRDQTEGIYGLPHYPSDPPLVTNNKGWWRDVCDLLDVMDGKPARFEAAR